MQINESLAKKLSLKALEMAGGRSSEIERYCWMVVHEHCHGVMPFEYDVKDVDEALYLSVLELAKLRIKST